MQSGQKNLYSSASLPTGVSAMQISSGRPVDRESASMRNSRCTVGVPIGGV
eukprot:CAMPEP_0119093490 /NCGR_PEP_ID=MMETSP1178-20130426/163268_1 /TAXON_ID=33656 /ORGANISM="unid sp, Strain CCMP2000" /LENGTH=50 /DNA_ID=CAMNT_0007077149 /DNA_START=127 /DNA_END=276 /DNA_ORIENTATION=-